MAGERDSGLGEEEKPSLWEVAKMVCSNGCQDCHMEASLVVMPQGEKEWGRQHGLCLRMVAAINTGAGTDQSRGTGRGEELTVFPVEKTAVLILFGPLLT